MKVKSVFLEHFYIYTYFNRSSLPIFKNIELYFDFFTICRRCLLHFDKPIKNKLYFHTYKEYIVSTLSVLQLHHVSIL